MRTPGSKQAKGAAAAEGARRATGAAAAAATADRGRFSSRRKAQAVLRLLRGESLERLSRELGVTAARLSQWREQFLRAGELGLQSREPDLRDEELGRLRAKIGELTMDRELLEEKIARLEGGVPLAWGRSKR